MRTLERYWAWHAAEKPPVNRARVMLDKNVSDAGRFAVELAASHIDCHSSGSGCLGHRMFTSEALAHYPEALRDLSLVLCRGLVRLYEQVPAHVPTPPPDVDAMNRGRAAVGMPLLPPSMAAEMASDLARHNRILAQADAAGMFDIYESPEQRVRCIRDPSEAGDGRYCRECLGEPCRFSHRKPAVAKAERQRAPSCWMHGEFYAGCLTCQQARYREQRERRNPNG